MDRYRRTRRPLAAVLLVLLLASLGGGASLAATSAPKKAPAEAPSEPIDINRASAEELTRIPGIGEAMARRIIDFRDKEGPFRRVEDLMKVKGIGEKSFQKLKAYVKVGKGG